MSASPLLFTQSSDEPALYVAGNSGSAGWCAYIVMDGQTPPPGRSLKLTDVNSTGGYVVFAAQAPTSSGTDFVQQVRAYVANAGSMPQLQVALLWLAQPDSISAASVPAACWLSSTSHDDPNALALLQPLNFSLGSNFITLSLAVSLQSTVTADDSGLYSFYVPAATTPTVAAQLAFATLQTNASIVDYFYVPLTGRGQGRMLFGSGFTTSLLPQYGVGMQFYYPGTQTNTVATLSTPLFSVGEQGSLALADTSFDPLNLLGPATYFAFNGTTQPPSQASVQPTVLPTQLLTSVGYQITLQPTGDCTTEQLQMGNEPVLLPFPGAQASLVVFGNPSTPPSTPPLPWVMQPRGYYRLGINSPYSPAGPVELLCGLAGTEVISFTPVSTTQPQGDFLAFQAGNAYAAGFVPGAPLASATALLDDTYYTAWAAVLPGSTATPAQYFAQPEGATLYGANAPAAANTPAVASFAPYFRSAAVSLTAQDATFFPLLTYGGEMVATAPQFESQVVSPARKNALTTLTGTPPVSTPSTVAAVTPQGLLVQVNQDDASVWQQVVLAQILDVTGQSPPQQIAFTPPSVPIKAALQTNQLFLVISGCIAQNLAGFQSALSIEGWPFNLAPPTADPYGNFTNVLLFKFRTGTLLDLVTQPACWAQPTQFNFGQASDGFGSLTSWLKRYVNAGVSQADGDGAGPGDPDYQHFATIVRDPNWQGVLALNVTIGTQDFPAGLQGLLAGIDLSRFSAHHFGIETNLIEITNGVPSLSGTSAMFGLIDYEDATFAQQQYSAKQYQQNVHPQTTTPYSFQVLSLKVLFENSKIKSYNSYLALTINQLFGATVSPSTGDTPSQNLLVLTGSYEDHDGHPVYAFNSLPSTANGSYRMSLEPGQAGITPALQAVEVVKATFGTSVRPTQTDDEVAAVFTFWGYLDFSALPGIDLLSYGNETGASLSQQGLCFANLTLDMSFPLTAPAVVSYTFDPRQLSFDLSQSTARAGSLARKFPVKLQTLLTGDESSLPSDQNYLPVQLPGLTTPLQASTGPWYGLQFSLNMGTLGSLAGSVGFTAQLLLAWNPDGTPAATGLLLPGVNPQAPFFSLQGILRLDVGSVSLNVATGTSGNQAAYLLKINNIAVKLFSLSFPPGGQVNFFLFGDPGATADPQSLGWYTAYQKNSSAAAADLGPATTPHLLPAAPDRA